MLAANLEAALAGLAVGERKTAAPVLVPGVGADGAPVAVGSEVGLVNAAAQTELPPAGYQSTLEPSGIGCLEACAAQPLLVGTPVRRWAPKARRRSP